MAPKSCTATLSQLHSLSPQNNIAEVEELQQDLLDEDLLEHVLALLQDSELEVSVRYFAGGILAQLASRPQAWTLSQELLAAVPEQLVGVWLQVRRDEDDGSVTANAVCLRVCPSVHLSWQHAAILTWTPMAREMVSYR